MYQAHQTKIAQMLGSRERYEDLMRLMIEHPEIDFRNLGDSNQASEEQLIGMSMWMSFWNTMWHIKWMDERALRSNVADLFRRRSACDWWTAVGASWSSKSSRSEQRFIGIVTEECIARSTAQPASADKSRRISSPGTELRANVAASADGRTR
jgi:hypothetical protein